MWAKVLGKDGDKASSSSSRRRDDDSRSKAGDSVVSSSSNRRSGRNEDRDRGIDDERDQRRPYKTDASAVSSYATAPTATSGYYAADSVRSRNGDNGGEVEQDPTKKSRRRRDRSASGDRKSSRRHRSGSREKDDRGDRKERKSKRRETDPGRSRGVDDGHQDATRAVGETVNPGENFHSQVQQPGFTQFPGQYDSSMPGIPSSSGPPGHAPMSSHVPDMFPGQFPAGVAAPYRPPIAKSEGGPGLAADYYGDTGESVTAQPGVRPQAPPLPMINADPHLMTASAVPAPPPEPSTLGGVGAAASFFSGASFESPSTSPKPGASEARYPVSTTSAPSSFSNAMIPTMGSAALGAAAGYATGTHASNQQGPNTSQSEQSHPMYHPQGYGEPQAYGPNPMQQNGSSTQLPHSSQASFTTAPSQPAQFTGESSSHSNMPMYAAGAVGALGLAAAAYEHHQQQATQAPHSQNPSYIGPPSSQPYSQPSFAPSGVPMGTSNGMMMQHKPHGPLEMVVEFFRDPEGVARFEEYSEYIGVCRNCFPPGSTIRDSPRRHNYRRRSNERLGAISRVDKESRYSDGENKRRNGNSSSWLTAGIAGVGLAEVGKRIFSGPRDFDDTYSVKSGRANASVSSLARRRDSSSSERRRRTPGGMLRKSSRRESSKDREEVLVVKSRKAAEPSRKLGLTEAALGAAIGGAALAAATRKRTPSPKSRREQKNRSGSPDSSSTRRRARKAREGGSSAYSEVPAKKSSRSKEKKSVGFFNLGNASSSSADSALAFGAEPDRASRRKSKSSSRITNEKEAAAAILGLGAATAALAAAESRNGKTKRKSEPVIKDGSSRDRRTSDQPQRQRVEPSRRHEEEGWESASEGHESVDSALAYGVRRRRSQESLSDSAGTGKWGWRWGSKKKRTLSPKADNGYVTATAMGLAGAAAGAVIGSYAAGQRASSQAHAESPGNLPPLQQVYPVPTSDPGRYDAVSSTSYPPFYGPRTDMHPGLVAIQQPQPYTPVSSALYNSQVPYDYSHGSQPSVPAYAGVATSLNRDGPAEGVSIPSGHYEYSPTQSREKAPLQRRNSSPTPHIVEIEPRAPKRRSTRDESSSVRFDLDDDQKAKEDRADRGSSFEPSRTAAMGVMGESSNNREHPQNIAEREETKEERRERREKRRRERALRKSSERSDSKDGQTRPDVVQDEKQVVVDEDGNDTQQKRSSWTAPALAGIAGAAAAAAISAGMKSRDHEDTVDARGADEPSSNRQYSHEQDSSSKGRDVAADEEDEEDVYRQAQARIARHAAAQIRKGPSPVHEDYSSFFAPTELLNRAAEGKEQVKDPNADNDISSYDVPEIVTIEPGKKATSSSPFASNEYEPISDPNFMQLPWQVPRLNLIQPTPPASYAGSFAGSAAPSPVIRPRDAAQKEVGTEEVEPTRPEPTNTHQREAMEDGVEASAPGPERAVEAEEEPLIIEAAPRHIPGQFDDDLDFAATLAAGAAASGFDPDIVINDPQYRRRDSPPGSDRSRPESGERVVEDNDDLDRTVSKKERKRKGKSSPPVKDDSEETVSLARDDGSHDAELDIIESASRDEPQDPKFEEWPSSKKSKKKKSKRQNRESEQFFEAEEQSEKASTAREVQDVDGDDVSSKTEGRKDTLSRNDDGLAGILPSVGATAAAIAAGTVLDNAWEESKKSGKKSKKKGSAIDDAATSSKNDENEEVNGNSTKNSGIFGLFSKSIDDAAEKRKSKDVEPGIADENEERNGDKKSKGSKSKRDLQDNFSRASDSVTDANVLPDEEEQKSTNKAKTKKDKRARKRANREEEFDGDGAEEALEELEEQQSFLGERREITKPPDLDQDEIDRDQRQAVSSGARNLIGERPSTPPQHGPGDDSISPFVSPARETISQRRRLSSIRSESGQLAGVPSPTAIPLIFRRVPTTPGATRSNPATPGQSPSLHTPKERKPRPTSSEFKSNEFRPLWLVERHQVREEIDPEEQYPSLPSSHSGSRASSVHAHSPTQEDGKGVSREVFPDLLDSEQATPTASTFAQSREQNLLDEARHDALASELEWTQRHSGEFIRRDAEKRISRDSQTLVPTSIIQDHPESSVSAARSVQDPSASALHDIREPVVATPHDVQEPVIAIPHDNQDPVVATPHHVQEPVIGTPYEVQEPVIAIPHDVQEPKHSANLAEGLAVALLAGGAAATILHEQNKEAHSEKRDDLDETRSMTEERSQNIEHIPTLTTLAQEEERGKLSRKKKTKKGKKGGALTNIVDETSFEARELSAAQGSLPKEHSAEQVSLPKDTSTEEVSFPEELALEDSPAPEATADDWTAASTPAKKSKKDKKLKKRRGPTAEDEFPSSGSDAFPAVDDVSRSIEDAPREENPVAKSVGSNASDLAAIAAAGALATAAIAGPLLAETRVHSEPDSSATTFEKGKSRALPTSDTHAFEVPLPEDDDLDLLDEGDLESLDSTLIVQATTPGPDSFDALRPQTERGFAGDEYRQAVSGEAPVPHLRPDHDMASHEATSITTRASTLPKAVEHEAVENKAIERETVDSDVADREVVESVDEEALNRRPRLELLDASSNKDIADLEDTTEAASFFPITTTAKKGKKGKKGKSRGEPEPVVAVEESEPNGLGDARLMSKLPIEPEVDAVPEDEYFPTKKTKKGKKGRRQVVEFEDAELPPSVEDSGADNTPRETQLEQSEDIVAPKSSERPVPEAVGAMAVAGAIVEQLTQRSEDENALETTDPIEEVQEVDWATPIKKKKGKKGKAVDQDIPKESAERDVASQPVQTPVDEFSPVPRSKSKKEKKGKKKSFVPWEDEVAEADAPVDELVDATVDGPVAAPMAAPVEAPLEAPLETPLEAHVELPVDAPVDAPFRGPLEALIEAPVEAPVDAPQEALPVEIQSVEAQPLEHVEAPPAEALHEQATAGSTDGGANTSPSRAEFAHDLLPEQSRPAVILEPPTHPRELAIEASDIPPPRGNDRDLVDMVEHPIHDESHLAAPTPGSPVQSFETPIDRDESYFSPRPHDAPAYLESERGNDDFQEAHETYMVPTSTTEKPGELVVDLQGSDNPIIEESAEDATDPQGLQTQLEQEELQEYSKKKSKKGKKKSKSASIFEQEDEQAEPLNSAPLEVLEAGEAGNNLIPDEEAPRDQGQDDSEVYSMKKSKKDKKKSKQSKFVDWQEPGESTGNSNTPEVERNLDEPDLEDPNLSEKAQTEQIQEPAEEIHAVLSSKEIDPEISSLGYIPETLTMAGAALTGEAVLAQGSREKEDDDDVFEYSAKKSKKDKKKAKKKAAFAWDDDVEDQNISAAPADDSHTIPGSSLDQFAPVDDPQEQLPITYQIPEEVAQESKGIEVHHLEPTLSDLATSPEKHHIEDVEPESEVRDISSSVETYPIEAQENDEQELERTFHDTAIPLEKPAVEERELEPTLSGAASPVEVPPTDDDFVGFSKKKKKKGKKAQQAQLFEPEPEPEPELSQRRSYVEGADDEPGREEASYEPEYETTNEVPSQPIEDEPIYGSVKWKKGKKNKKDKTPFPVVEDDEPQVSRSFDTKRDSEHEVRELDTVSRSAAQSQIAEQRQFEHDGDEDLREVPEELSHRVIDANDRDHGIIAPELEHSHRHRDDAPKSSNLARNLAAAGLALGAAAVGGIVSTSSTSEKMSKTTKLRKGDRAIQDEDPIVREEALPQIHHDRELYHEDREIRHHNRDSGIPPMTPPTPHHTKHLSHEERDSGYHEGSPLFRQLDSNRQSLTESVDQPLNVSVEVGPGYDVSVTGPGHHEYSQSHGEHVRELSPVEPAAEHHPSREPSHSHPLAREPGHSHPSHGLGDAVYMAAGAARDVSHTSVPERSHEEYTSIFGGPVGKHNEHESTRSPRTPLHQERPTLNTIVELSPDEPTARARASEEHHEHSRELLAASADKHHATPSRKHVRSPLSRGPRQLGHIPNEDPLSRLSWPDVDDENHVIDFERSRSRNADQRASSRETRPTRGPAAIGEPGSEHRSFSGASIRSADSINAYIRPSPVASPGTPPLRRADRSVSSDLRSANKRGITSDASGDASREMAVVAGTAALAASLASSSTYDPLTDKGKGRITKMTDVYEGWGDVNESPRSPTRPASLRRRQSMQIVDLESRLDAHVSENRQLHEARGRAERNLDDAVHDHAVQKKALTDSIESRDLYLKQKDSELAELRSALEGLQGEVSRLTQVNAELTSRSVDFTPDHVERYRGLEDEHAQTKTQFEDSSRELDELRQKHASLSTGMEGIVAHEVSLALQGKNAELEQLKDELEATKQQVRALQQQILGSRKSDDLLVIRDEDYFDSRCQELCQHVQQWVLRFSKFSDMKQCRSISEIMDEKIVDRFENAILDGTDVNLYLSDRIKRRDVFMSVVMTMVWEYIFTRYLFGMDREQRQKLKSLERTLSEVGPPTAVSKWRAMTLTMLSRREAFMAQREQDTQAVAEEIYQTLYAFLPPPNQLVGQIMDSLLKVMAQAVDLSIEMRTQLAEYIMLPPLQPEYDTNGDLAQTIAFNAPLMNERSGDTTDLEELEAQGAIVRIVLFPLVVKRGDDDGLGNEEIVVCPAQVLVAKDGPARSRRTTPARVMSGQGPRGNQSVQSFAPSTMDAAMGGMI